MTYLRNLFGNRSDPNLIGKMLENGLVALNFLKANTAIRFRVFKGVDYRTDVDGASLASRTVEPMPLDDRELSEAHRLLSPPFHAFTLFHGMQFDNRDLASLQDALRYPVAMARTLGMLARHYGNLLRYGRSTRRMRGNALIGMLLQSAIARGVGVRVGARCTRLLREQDRVSGVEFEQGGETRRVAARHGVILASGGFSADAGMRAENAPHAEQHRGLPPLQNVGIVTLASGR